APEVLAAERLPPEPAAEAVGIRVHGLIFSHGPPSVQSAVGRDGRPQSLDRGIGVVDCRVERSNLFGQFGYPTGAFCRLTLRLKGRAAAFRCLALRVERRAAALGRLLP